MKENEKFLKESIDLLAEAQVILHRLDTKTMSLQSDLHSKNLLVQISLSNIKHLENKIKILERTNKKLLADASL